MKTVIITSLDNLAFSSADLLNPSSLKLIGFAVPMKEAWNIYDEKGNVSENISEMPIMPLEAAVKLEPDEIIIAADNLDDEEKLKYQIFRTGYMGEVISLYNHFSNFTPVTAAIRKLAWRMDLLGVKGAIADFGCGHGDISWQMNALMPDRKLYLFDTFTGYDARDIAKEETLQLSTAKTGDYSFTERELMRLDQLLLGRMPYPNQVVIQKGWFPESAFALEEETYALVYMEADLYAPTYSGIQYFYSRLSPGGVIILKGYEDGKSLSVRQAINDLEAQYGAFPLVPLCDLQGTVIISRP